MVVTVKNEVNRARGQTARPPEQGLAGALQAVQETRQKSIFSSRKFGLYINTLQSVSPSGELSMGTDLLFVFFRSTTEHGVTRAFRNANRARVTSELFCPEEGLHSRLFIFIYFYSFSLCVCVPQVCTKLKKQYSTANTVLSPLTTKNSTILLLTQPTR